jgi:ABC-type uncharacterized transport system substrate-binding protein
MNARSYFASAIVLLALASPARAHPHAFIEMTSDVVFDDAGLIKAINVEWVFDSDYSSMATEGLDTNKDGMLSTDELQPLAKENVDSLKEWSYFVYGRVNGEKLKWADVADYGQLMGDDGRLRMHFVVPFLKPVDPRTAEFIYRIYDPTFYIAIDFVGKDPVEALGNKPPSCRIEIRKPPDPNETQDTKAMLSTKGKDWTPDQEDDFGIMFAQPVAVVCKPGAAG